MSQDIPSTDHSARSGLFSAYLGLLAIAGSLIALDQWTKSLVRAQLSFGEQLIPWPELPFLSIVHWRNTGAAFGMFQEAGGIFAVLAVAVAGMIIYYFPRIPQKEWALRLAMSLQLAGAVGNLIDRLRQGYVTDFISVGSFPIFNVADASITVGVGLLLLSLWLSGELKPKKEAAAPEQISGD